MCPEDKMRQHLTSTQTKYHLVKKINKFAIDSEKES